MDINLVNNRYFDRIFNSIVENVSKCTTIPVDDIIEELNSVKKTKNLTELTDIVKKLVARQIESGEEV